MFFGGCSWPTPCIALNIRGIRQRQQSPGHKTWRINTAVLIVSSFTMAIAVYSTQVAAGAPRLPADPDNDFGRHVPWHKGIEYHDKYTTI